MPGRETTMSKVYCFPISNVMFPIFFYTDFRQHQIVEAHFPYLEVRHILHKNLLMKQKQGYLPLPFLSFRQFPKKISYCRQIRTSQSQHFQVFRTNTFTVSNMKDHFRKNMFEYHFYRCGCTILVFSIIAVKIIAKI